MQPFTADVLVISVVGAQPAKLRIRRRALPVSDRDGAADVPLLLATFIHGTEPLRDRGEAERLVNSLKSEESRQEWVDRGLYAVNKAIRGYRAGSRDPYVVEVAERDARAVRIGYGSRDEVASGQWKQAFVLPPPQGERASRAERLAPSEVTGDVLSGRGEVLQAEELILRTYQDLDHGRLLGAVHQVRAAIDLLGMELADRQANMGADFNDLASRVESLASGVRIPEQELEAEVEGVLEQLERAVSSWRYEAVEL